MEPGPAKIAEALLYWLLPPACREEVLGDMRERHRNSAQYLMEAASTVPFVIYSRIRRTTDAVVALVEVVSMYTAFAMAAWWLGHETLLSKYGFVRLALPPAVLLVTIILSDAYSHPNRLWPLKPLVGPALGLALTYAVELSHRWALPALVLAWGGAISVLLVSILRLSFRPLTDARTAKIPAHWQKLELSPSLSQKYVVPVILMATILCLVLIGALR